MIGNYEAIMAIGQHAVTHGSCPIAETTYWNARAIHQWNQDFRIWPEPRIQWTGLQIAMLIKCLACNLQCLDWSDFADEICKTHRSAANAENRKILNKNFLLKMICRVCSRTITHPVQRCSADFSSYYDSICSPCITASDLHQWISLNGIEPNLFIGPIFGGRKLLNTTRGVKLVV